MKRTVILLALALSGTARAERVTVYEFDPAQVTASPLAVKTDTAPDAWARLRKGDFAGARDAFLAAASKAAEAARADLLQGYLVAAVMLGTAPDQAVSAWPPTGDWQVLLQTVARTYHEYGSEAQVRDMRAVLAPALKDEASGRAGLRIHAAADAYLALRWDQVVAELTAAWKEAGSDAKAQEMVAAELERTAQSLLHIYTTALDRKAGEAARALSAVGPATPAAKQRMADLDERLARKSDPKVTVQGSLDKETLRGLIVRHNREISSCYGRELVVSPAAAGSFALRFEVDPAGAVIKADSAEATGKLGKAPDCIAAAARKWRFPGVGGVTKVTYRIVLQPSP